MKWSKSEIDYLVKYYSNQKNEFISKHLNRSINSIKNKAINLELKKSDAHIANMISHRNKIIGRNLNFDKLKEIALLYKTRSEFQRMDASAYVSARNMRILDDICTHMIKQSYSTPQLILKHILSELLGDNLLYNTKKIITPYELDIYFPYYKLAFEYNGKKWHENDTINKQDMCAKRGITLFTIIENNRNYELDIKQQLSRILNDINKITRKEINISQLFNINITPDIFNDILDNQQIIAITTKYTNYHKFITENKELYRKLSRLDKLTEYTSHMHKRNIQDEISDIIAKYEYLIDFINNDRKYYTWIKKNNKEHLIETLKRR